MDIIGRLACDQFVVLMPSMPLSVAETIAEKVRCQVQLSSLTHMGHPLSNTCSIGMVCFNEKVEDISQNIRRLMLSTESGWSYSGSAIRSVLRDDAISLI